MILSLDHRHLLRHARYAVWHVGQQQRYPTSVCSGPVVNCPPGAVVVEEVLSSPSTVRRQVVFGRPCFRFLSGAQRRAMREMLPGSFSSHV